MFQIILGSIVAFVSTEIDDLVTTLVLFGRTKKASQRIAVIIGKYLGLAILAVGSGAFAYYISKIPAHYIGFLGLIPLAIGIKEALESIQKKQKKPEDSQALESKFNAAGFFIIILTALVVTLADGGDNIAVYISFFSSLSGFEFLVAGIVFFVLQALFFVCAWLFVNIFAIKNAIQKTEAVLVPVLFIGLGIYIMIEDGTIAWLFELMK